MSATPLCIDATVVGPIVELRYASHTEAFKQLYALRRALEANAQLLAALSWFVMLQRSDGENHNDCFERVGEVFHRDTGYLRPGKDCRLHSDEERTEAWDKWVQQHINAARAAIAAATGSTQ